jgi:hypothetical protein
MFMMSQELLIIPGETLNPQDCLRTSKCQGFARRIHQKCYNDAKKIRATLK